MMDPNFSGEIRFVFINADGSEEPVGCFDNINITFKDEEKEIKKEKTFPQAISDIISEYEQMLVDWDMSRISDDEMQEKLVEFQLKSRPMILDMLSEFKTINHILGYLRTMINSTRIAALYGDNSKTFNELSDILKELDFLRNKIEFNKVEPAIGRSAGPDEIEKFVSADEDIEILDLNECNNCDNCNCKEETPKATIEQLVDYLVMDYEARMDNYARSSSEAFMKGENTDRLYNSLVSDKEHAQIIATRLKTYIRCYLPNEIYLNKKLDTILREE